MFNIFFKYQKIIFSSNVFGFTSRALIEKIQALLSATYLRIPRLYQQLSSLVSRELVFPPKTAVVVVGLVRDETVFRKLLSQVARADYLVLATDQLGLRIVAESPIWAGRYFHVETTSGQKIPGNVIQWYRLSQALTEFSRWTEFEYLYKTRTDAVYPLGGVLPKTCPNNRVFADRDLHFFGKVSTFKKIAEEIPGFFVSTVNDVHKQMAQIPISTFLASDLGCMRFDCLPWPSNYNLAGLTRFEKLVKIRKRILDADSNPCGKSEGAFISEMQGQDFYFEGNNLNAPYSEPWFACFLVLKSVSVSELSWYSMMFLDPKRKG